MTGAVTTYTIRAGGECRTTDPHVAEEFARSGCRVTARTAGVGTFEEEAPEDEQ